MKKKKEKGNRGGNAIGGDSTKVEGGKREIMRLIQPASIQLSFRSSLIFDLCAMKRGQRRLIRFRVSREIEYVYYTFR